MSNILICPICKHKLTEEDNTLSCPTNHAFDISKEGYVNLLVANKKNSKNPGDSKEMVDSRRQFLDKGYYLPVADKMKEMILDLGPSDITVLDSCCGEGYYTHHVSSDPALEITDCHGFDISKPAIIAAAKRYQEVKFNVSKVNNIPLESESVDIIQTVFAPLSSSEFYRVLKEEGFVLVVYSGPMHLKELASQVYDEFKPHKYHPKSQLDRFFTLVEEQELQFNISLDNKSDILALLKMTPYYWNTHKDKLEKITALDSLDLTCDFRFSLFMKNNPHDEEE